MTMPKQIVDQIAAYRAHTQKARDHLSKANYEAKKILLARGLELNAQDHDYRWSILGEKCEASPINVHVGDSAPDDYTVSTYCIYCGGLCDWD